MAEVGLDGALADAQACTDLGGRKVVHGEARDLVLARGEGTDAPEPLADGANAGYR